MDFEYDLNEEKERENAMEIVIDEIKIEIPETLVEEMMTLLSFSSQDELRKEILISGKALKKCFSENELKEKPFEQRLIEYLEDEINIYNP